MENLKQVIIIMVLLIITVMFTSCSTINVKTYASNKPVLKPEEFLKLIRSFDLAYCLFSDRLVILCALLFNIHLFHHKRTLHFSYNYSINFFSVCKGFVKFEKLEYFFVRSSSYPIFSITSKAFHYFTWKKIRGNNFTRR